VQKAFFIYGEKGFIWISKEVLILVPTFSFRMSDMYHFNNKIQNTKSPLSKFLDELIKYLTFWV